MLRVETLCDNMCRATVNCVNLIGFVAASCKIINLMNILLHIFKSACDDPITLLISSAQMSRIWLIEHVRVSVYKFR